MARNGATRAKTLDAFDFTVADGVDATAVADLAHGGWIAERRNVILAGPIGTGKTRLAIALGEAARQRRHVAFCAPPTSSARSSKHVTLAISAGTSAGAATPPRSGGVYWRVTLKSRPLVAEF
jgi:hypothetical protein